MKTEITSVTTRRHPVANTFHLIMTVITCGLWAPVWYFCARGHKVTTRAPVAAYGSVLPGQACGGFTVAERAYMAEHVPGAAKRQH